MTKQQKQALIDLLAASLGGVVGAVATTLLQRAGVKRNIAAFGVTAAGGVAVAFSKGAVRAAAGGVAAAGAGQLVASWFAALDKRVKGESATPNSDAASQTRRNAQAFSDSLVRAFDEAAARVRVDAEEPEPIQEQPEAIEDEPETGKEESQSAQSSEPTIEPPPEVEEPLVAIAVER